MRAIARDRQARARGKAIVVAGAPCNFDRPGRRIRGGEESHAHQGAIDEEVHDHVLGDVEHQQLVVRDRVDHVVAGVDARPPTRRLGERVAGHVLAHQAAAHVEAARPSRMAELAQLPPRAGERGRGARAEALHEQQEPPAEGAELDVREPAPAVAEQRHRGEKRARSHSSR